ncbi:MAG: MFS transporter [Gammaproteobacteria bacterium]|nr:MFS transporter [Gammaproteobacteria bacterium]
MWTDLRASWALLTGMALMMVGNGLQGTLLGLRATMEGFETFTTGVMMSGFYVGIFIGSMLAPRLVQRVGHIRVFAALASLVSIAILVHAIYVNPVTWTFMRFLTGLGYAGLYVVCESWLNDRASNETRGQVLSVYMVICTLGLAGGQFLLSIRSPMEVDLFILISVIVSFGLIPMLLTARPAPSFETSSSMSLVALYRASPLAVISSGLTGAAHGIIFGLGAVYARQKLNDVDLVALFMASFLLGSLLLQWPIGWASDRIGRRSTMAALSFLSIISCLLAVQLGSSGTLFFILIAVVGGLAIPMYPLCIAYANDRLEPEQIVGASGSLVMVSGIGLSIGPIFASYLMGEYGADFFFFGIASAFVLILCFTLYRMTKREGIDIEEQGSTVVPGQIGTPVAEYNAPDAEIYIEAVASGEVEKLDEEDPIPSDPGTDPKKL